MYMGDGRAHFRIQREEDLEVVLAHRLYHYDGSMVALERWIPTVRRDFPTTIPFWITINGLPDYRREEEKVTSIDEALGEFLTVDVTQPIPRVRVTLDCNSPLLFRSESDDEGQICVIDFQYEKLQKYCVRCLRMTHEAPSCPERVRESQAKREHRRESHWKQEEEGGRRKTSNIREEEVQSVNPPTLARLPPNLAGSSSFRRKPVRRDILPELESTRGSVVKQGSGKQTTKDWVQKSFGSGALSRGQGSTNCVEQIPSPRPVAKRAKAPAAPWYKESVEEAAITIEISF